MKKTESIIFDIDGTLWDSTAEVAVLYNECIEESFPDPSRPLITKEILKTEFGKPMNEIARDLFPELPEEKRMIFMDHLCRRENEYLRSHPPTFYDGVVDTIRALSKCMPVFIVSNCQVGYIELFLELSGLGSCVTDHLGYGDTLKGKADNLTEIARRNHLQNSAYVGDTFGDYLAVRKAGMSFIYASYGFGSVPDPDLTILRPKDLLSLCGD